MRIHARDLVCAALVIIGISALCALACNWDIVTQGEINDGETTDLLKTDSTIAANRPDFPVIEPMKIIPKIIKLLLYSVIYYEGGASGFVEMEVGELLLGVNGAPDTIIVKHRP